ncbi:VOC family protein [Knoellia aerolata]|uniref:Glyoxalase n=1 Tax=Knoellia aerolata DSM 18566 TaxID=1385519 RepID=A0A0A0JXV6_9MICO|nr:VOC family protein [Knoellia aerolata]KGN41524.1 glyoxalase [Knoellia aerolata DSM 18566]
MDQPQPELGITIDCTDARVVADFWAHALGWVQAPPPPGWSDWPSFLRDHEVPEEEWGDGASICPRSGGGPRISFLKVPEPKTVKNRLHLDVRVSGGRAVEQSLREQRIRATEADLVARGARLQREDRFDGHLDHLVMEDPEGNEFCIV